MRDLTVEELLEIAEKTGAHSLIVLLGAPGERTVLAMKADEDFVRECGGKLLGAAKTMPFVAGVMH